MTQTMRTLVIVAVAAIWTLSLLWVGSQLSGETMQDEIVRICETRDC